MAYSTVEVEIIKDSSGKEIKMVYHPLVVMLPSCCACMNYFMTDPMTNLSAENTKAQLYAISDNHIVMCSYGYGGNIGCGAIRVRNFDLDLFNSLDEPTSPIVFAAMCGDRISKRLLDRLDQSSLLKIRKALELKDNE
jgi:hypothetical protein